MNNLQIISKGLYNGTVDAAFPIEVREYIFSRNEGKKCLLLRFLNHSKLNITALNFWLVQKDSCGECIARDKITLSGIYLVTEELFTPNNYYPVKENCVSFDVEMVSAFSGEYEYKTKNGESFIRYSLASSEKQVARKNSFCHKHSKLRGKVKFTTMILVFAIISTLVAIIMPFYINVVHPIVVTVIKNVWELIGRAWDSLWKEIGEAVEIIKS